MVTNVYKVFLASPGDTKDERVIAEKVVDEINSTLGGHHNFRVDLLKWENSTYPSFGADGQDVINTQIGDNYDIFIGIMWKKFGTPTNRADSGTLEEFERAYRRYLDTKDVKIMFYFNSSALPQEGFDPDQFVKVTQFKQKVASMGGITGIMTLLQLLSHF